MVTVEICMGTSCHLLGSQDLLDAIEALPSEQRQLIEVKGITCFKSCGKGPNVKINGVLRNGVTPDILLEALQNNL